ncbi:hypothetical protein CI109_103070 [Kwoniella shandongensis]|uniref:Polynucleotide 5'-hydroxyl-kinase GRC3 n=1 Tax=Kwoniella shandongensis TaxID=1734106 RepID=A0A5M6CA09_9TREE|nr:uncharacterized protein CI109_000261 [Kwoniella shandongensis]KAA5531420.1 hypothetical protein CI109_000261 [Kwoniella shandongensis]
MSALAARRAAAAAAPQVSQVPTTPSARPTVAASPSPSVEEDELTASEDEADSLSSASAPPSPKRRKTAKPSPKSRYFAKEPAPARPALSTSAKKQRRFSPSAPVDESEEEEDAVDSSVGDSDADVPVEDIYDEARDEVDEGRVQWSLPTTPAADSTPGPSRLRGRSTTQTTSIESTSKYNPTQGVNLIYYAEEALNAAGLVGRPGPGVLISLVKDESLMMAGRFLLTPLSGTIQLFSTTLTSASNEAHPVFAPTSHPLPVIKPLEKSKKGNAPSSKYLSKLKLPSTFQRGSAVFLLQELRSGLEDMRYGAVPEFARVWLEEEGPWGLKGVHPIIGSISTPVYPYVTPPTWSEALSDHKTFEPEMEELQNPLVALVKGPKRSGKSTFARALLNSLLNRYEKVAWLECDLGQGEFGCGGVVGLWVLDRPVFGPPFTHPAVPVRAHYLGTFTPLTCPDEYIAAIRQLIEHYRYNVQLTGEADDEKIGSVIPLIINTQGWVKGLGEDLLREIEAVAEPSQLYAFESAVQEDENNYQGPGWTQSPTWGSNLALPSTATKTFTLETAPISPLQARYTPADLRVLSTITYFHSSLVSQTAEHLENGDIASTPTSFTSSVRWDFSAPLLASPPWEVEYGLGKAINRVHFIGEGSDGVVEEDLPVALNGAIVALHEVLDVPDEEDQKLYSQGRPLPPLESVNFLGLALVRAVTPEIIHLITPLPPSKLARCSVIVKNGAIELPTPGMLDWRSGGVSEEGMAGNGWDEVPFLDVSGVEVVAGERRRFRKNIMRKGQ